MNTNLITTDRPRIAIPAGAYVWSYGGGVDSTAGIIECFNQGLDAPAMITFGDTGAEKPETYAYLDIFDKWLVSVGWPKITRCKKLVLPKTAKEKYTDFIGNLLFGETLPFYSWGKISCSPKWKQIPQDYAIKGCGSWHNKIEPSKAWVDFQNGAPAITKMIGYDSTEISRIEKSDKANAKNKSPFAFQYPLYEAGLDRQACIKIIKAAGLPVPLKSACWVCPSSQPWEVIWLAAVHPDLFETACAVERKALTGKHSRWAEVVDFLGWEDLIKEYDHFPKFKACFGLGISYSWNHLARLEGIHDADGNFIGDPAKLLARANELKADGGNAADRRTCA